MARLAALFFEQANLTKFHAAIDRLAHIVNRKQRTGDRSERLHFNAGTAYGLHRGGTNHCGGTLPGFEFDGDARDRDRVRQRNPVWRAFGGLDRGNACDAQYVALFCAARKNLAQGGRLHANATACACEAVGFGFGANIDHVCLAGSVEMRQFGGFRHGGELKRDDRYHSTMKWLPLITACCVALSPPVSAELPDLGEASQATFSPQLERKVGEAIMRDIRADKDYLDDAEVADYLNSIGYRLAASSPNNRQDFEFFAVHDPTLNAFALPGGYIGVHTGLITTTQTESELAGVLAHEIAHVTQRHISRMVAQNSRNDLLSIAGLALAILVARASTEAASAVGAVAQAGAIQSALDFTRENEREADRVGFVIMNDAGFDPRGMADFFVRLGKATRLYENNAPAYLRTHPLTTDRLSDLQNRIAVTPYRQVKDSVEFHLIRAKLNAANGTPADAITTFDTGLKEKRYANEAAQRYGLVAALLRAKQFDRAERESAVLRKVLPGNPIVENQAAELKRAEGQDVAALPIYREALRRSPFHRALIYGYADTLLRTRHGPEALNFLNEQLKVRSNDAHLYDYQAQAYAATGQGFASHRALAEAYARRGQLVPAIEQLQIALKLGNGDFYQLSSAEARLKELRAQDAENRKP